MYRRRWGRGARFVSAAALAGVCSGCSSDGTDSSSFAGNLGQASFVYACIDGTDPACAVSSTVAEGTTVAASSGATPAGEAAPKTPREIAVGSSFRLTYRDGSDVNVGDPVVRAVSSQFLVPASSGPGDFHVVAPGYAAVYLVSTVNSDFVDYALLHLVTVDTLRIGDEGGVTLASSSALTGSTPTAFTATPLADGVEAAGALDFEWSVDDSTLLDLTVANPTARMTVAPKGQAGRVTLSVRGAGLSASLLLEVAP